MKTIVCLARQLPAVVLSASCAIGHCATITVTTIADTVKSGDGCTLREAIMAANGDIRINECAAGAGADVITFEISPNQDAMISLLSDLPVLTGSTLIDGRGQPGSKCPFQPAISITPATDVPVAHGLRFGPEADGSGVYGLRLHGFYHVLGERTPTVFGTGIEVVDVNGFAARCNVLGVDTNQLSAGRMFIGMEVTGSSSVVIGGRDGRWTDNSSANLIAAQQGLSITDSEDVVVAGNWFGAAPRGVISDVNVFGGIYAEGNVDLLVGVDPLNPDVGGGNVFSSAALHAYGSNVIRAFGNRMGIYPDGGRLPGQRYAMIGVVVTEGVVEIGRWDPVHDPQHRLANIISDGGECLLNLYLWSGCGVSVHAEDDGVVQLSGNLLLGEAAEVGGEPAFHGLISFFSSPGATVSHNAFTRWGGALVTVDVAMQFSPTSIGNCMEGNSGAAVTPYGGTISFPNNWWGSPDGPGGAGNGQGDPVDSGVDYEPFLTERPDSCRLLALAPRGSNTIPAVSTWSLILMISGLLVIAALVLHRSRAV